MFRKLFRVATFLVLAGFLATGGTLVPVNRAEAAELSAVDYFRDVGAHDAYRILTDADVTRHFDDIGFGEPWSATTLENMILSLEYILEANVLRASLGLPVFQVSDTLMATAIVNTDRARNASGAHSGQFAGVSENLAWGYGSPNTQFSPFKGWYDKEKDIFDSALVSGDYPGLETMTNYQISVTYPGLWQNVGHYKILIDPQNTVTGFGTSRGGDFSYISSHAQHFNTTGKAISALSGELFTSGRIMTPEDYLADLIDYRDRGASSGPTVTEIVPGTVTLPATAEVGELIHAVVDGWSPANGINFTYRWFRNGQEIQGATGSSYRLVQEDLSKNIYVTVTGSYPGVASESVASDNATWVQSSYFAPEIVSKEVTIDGLPKVGEILWASTDVWEPYDVELTYQWRRDGKNIIGAQESFYILEGVDAGKRISVTVTGTLWEANPSRVEVSSESLLVAPGVATLSKPEIIGGTSVGDFLFADVYTFYPYDVELSYQWYREGKAITGARDYYYVTSGVDENKKITVKVTASKVGYTTSSQTSGAVKITAQTFTDDYYSPPNVSKVTSKNRLSGSNRFATSVEISKATFKPGVPAVYVANGMDFPDALAGAAVAGSAGAPVLLVNKTNIPAEVKAEIKRLKPANIFVLGGKGVVTDSVLNQLKPLASQNVKRLSGDNRFATSAAISKQNFPQGAGIVFVASGMDFPDALAGAALASSMDAPVLLVAKTSIPEEIKAELKRLKPGIVVVLGGKGVVSDAVLKQLRSVTGGDTVRLAGSNRFETAVEISRFASPPSVDLVYIANGMNFPDALSGAAVAGVYGAPVLLVTNSAIPAEVKAELRRLKPKKIVVLGGAGVISNKVQKELLTYER